MLKTRLKHKIEFYSIFKIQLNYIMKNDISKLIDKINSLDINNDEKNEIINLINNVKQKDEKAKKVKDPNEPKKPKNSFMLFMDDIRKIKDNNKYSSYFSIKYLDDVKEILKNNEGKPVSNLSKDCGILWKKLSSDEKLKYENGYKKNKLKYNKEMEIYNKK